MSDNIISTCTIANGQTCLHSIELDIEYRESLDEKTSTLTSFYGTVSHVTNLTVFFLLPVQFWASWMRTRLICQFYKKFVEKCSGFI